MTAPDTTHGHDDLDRMRRVLAERAAELARSSADTDPGDVRDLVVVAVADERYGLDVAAVREVRPLTDVTAIPAVPPHWLGLVNVRGDLMPVLDLGRYLGRGIETVPGDGAQAVVLAAGGHVVALRVDDVLPVRTVAADTIGPPLEDDDGRDGALYLGLTDDLVAILDAGALVADAGLLVEDAVD